MTLVAAIGFWEWTGIAGVSEQLWRVTALAFLVVGLLALQVLDLRWAEVLLIVPALAAFLAGLQRRLFLWIGLGLVYVAVPSAALVLLRQAAAPAGWGAILFILVVVWATDIAAYFAGRGFGGPKLWLRVSPKKTWSGAIGGLAAALVAGGADGGARRESGVSRPAFSSPRRSRSRRRPATSLESAMKRRFGVKDSGTIIPGHGGVLDRVDGLFGAAALAWCLAALGLGGGILLLPVQSGPVS